MVDYSTGTSTSYAVVLTGLYRGYAGSYASFAQTGDPNRNRETLEIDRKEGMEWPGLLVAVGVVDRKDDKSTKCSHTTK